VSVVVNADKGGVMEEKEDISLILAWKMLQRS
jgi:hypothetical protein